MTITINTQTLLTIGMGILVIFVVAKLFMYMWEERPSHKAGLYHGDKEAIAREKDKIANSNGRDNNDGIIILLFFISALILVLVAPFL